MLGLMEISTGNMPCTMHQTNTRGLVTARAPHFYFPWEIIARFGYSAPYLMLKKDIYALFHENEGHFCRSCQILYIIGSFGGIP